VSITTLVLCVLVLTGAALASSPRRTHRRLATPLVLVGVLLVASACTVGPPP
jgi:hypothetical protein